MLSVLKICQDLISSAPHVWWPHIIHTWCWVTSHHPLLMYPDLTSSPHHAVWPHITLTSCILTSHHPYLMLCDLTSPPPNVCWPQIIPTSCCVTSHRPNFKFGDDTSCPPHVSRIRLWLSAGNLKTVFGPSMTPISGWQWHQRCCTVYST